MPKLDPSPKLSKIRERSLTSLLDRRAEFLKVRDALEQFGTEGRFPEELDLQRQRSAHIESSLDWINDSIKRIRKQNADIAADRAAHPLRPAARRDPANNAAILGMLELERRRTASLKREAYARAQASAASRSRYDLKQAYRLSGGPLSQDASFRGEASFYDLRGVDVPTPADPCIDYLRTQRVRRQVMFARGFAPHGYRVSHRRNPC